ncbi:MAG: peptidoglycan DD-metalloendopeptidase family protein [Alphaproteobacteria bacterium]|nr:peptidoglycan DD-metalloendopeptidase family protein [Alphaproteobacteria bacterium]
MIFIKIIYLVSIAFNLVLISNNSSAQTTLQKKVEISQKIKKTTEDKKKVISKQKHYKKNLEVSQKRLDDKLTLYNRSTTKKKEIDDNIKRLKKQRTTLDDNIQNSQKSIRKISFDIAVPYHMMERYIFDPQFYDKKFIQQRLLLKLRQDKYLKVIKKYKVEKDKLKKNEKEINNSKNRLDKTIKKIDVDKKYLINSIKIYRRDASRLAKNNRKLQREIDTLVKKSKDLDDLIVATAKKKTVAKKTSTVSRKWMSPAKGKDRTNKSSPLIWESRTDPSAIVFSPTKGKVIFAQDFRGYKKLLILQTENDYYVIISGLDTFAVSIYDDVNKGQIVGAMNRIERVLTVEVRDNSRTIIDANQFI